MDIFFRIDAASGKQGHYHFTFYIDPLVEQSSDSDGARAFDNQPLPVENITDTLFYLLFGNQHVFVDQIRHHPEGVLVVKTDPSQQRVGD